MVISLFKNYTWLQQFFYINRIVKVIKRFVIFWKGDMYTDLYHQFLTAITSANLIPLIHIRVYNFKQLYETTIKKDFMRIILFESSKPLKLYIIFVYHTFEYFSSFTKIYIFFLIDARLYPQNFGNVSYITVKIRQF